MRRSKSEQQYQKTKFIDFLMFREKGFTLKEIIAEHQIMAMGPNSDPIKQRFVWSRATVFRMLKDIENKNPGLIIKEKDSTKGKRGRPKFRYKLNPDKKLVSVYAPGLRYERLGKPIVRLNDEEKKLIKDLKRASNLSKRIKKRLD